MQYEINGLVLAAATNHSTHNELAKVVNGKRPNPNTCFIKNFLS